MIVWKILMLRKTRKLLRRQKTACKTIRLLEYREGSAQTIQSFAAPLHGGKEMSELWIGRANGQAVVSDWSSYYVALKPYPEGLRRRSVYPFDVTGELGSLSVFRHMDIHCWC